MQKTKAIQVTGHDGAPEQVDVVMEAIDHSGHSPAFKFTAKIGDSVHVHHHTIGSESGEIADYTAQTLQAELDGVANKVAEAAAKRHKVRELFKEIA